jgi:predicted ATPase
VIKSIKLTNFLSFGANSEEVTLHKFNVIIGKNGSGKSNFLEAIDLLRNAPSAMTTPIRGGGGVTDWLFKGMSRNPAIMEFTIENSAHVSKASFPNILYKISFADEGQRFTILDEKITSTEPKPGHKKLYLFYDYSDGHPILNVKTGSKETDYYERRLSREEISPEQSILKQRHDPDSYPEISSLAKELAKIKIYRDWALGRETPMRKPVNVDITNDFVEDDCSNLPLMLNQIEYLGKKTALLEQLRLFYNNVEDYTVTLHGGTAQLFFRESGLNGLIPATRLSDGSLRYLFLLCILLHPSPPPVICIDEPELGLHPDILPTVGRLLVEASERCQLIVTTHSPALIDSLSHMPECVLVAEKDGAESTIIRLDKEELAPWLERYRLGELWQRGDIGGNIW